jgi:hypothetical protein
VRDAVANVVDRLEERGFEPHRVGEDEWEARCPVHRSVDHALAISRGQHSHVVLACRGPQNCQHFRIIGALGITNDHVYAETPQWLIDRVKRVALRLRGDYASTRSILPIAVICRNDRSH